MTEEEKRIGRMWRVTADFFQDWGNMMNSDVRDNDELLHGDVTEAIIGAFYRVYNSLGVGFLEKVYRNAMAVSRRMQGFDVKVEFPIRVRFEGEVVGKYYADLLVANRVIVEIKRADITIDAHEAQLANYLKATHIEVGLLLHFGNKPHFRRRIYLNDKKPHLRPKAPGTL